MRSSSPGGTRSLASGCSPRRKNGQRCADSHRRHAVISRTSATDWSSVVVCIFLGQEADGLPVLLLEHVDSLAVVHPPAHDTIDVPAGHIGLHEGAESRITRAVSQS